MTIEREIRIDALSVQVEATWGAKAIGALVGVSVHTIYRWERLRDCPITKVNGRYFVLKSALMRWVLSKSPQC